MRLYLVLIALLPFTSVWANTLLISNVNVVDVKKGMILPAKDVLISDGKIINIATNISVANQTEVVNGNGRYLIPGLWDMHAHLQDLGESSLNQFLYYGVTQVRDMGGDPTLLLNYKNQINNQTRIGPDIYSALYMIGSPRFADIMQKFMPSDDWQAEQKRRIIVGDKAQATAAVDKIKNAGGDFVKLHWNHNKETLTAIIQRAEQLGLDVVGHDPGPNISLIDIAKSGLRSYEHVDGDFFYKLSQLSDEEFTQTVNALKANDLHISSTLVMWTAFTRLAAIEDKAQAAEILAKHPDGLKVDDKLVTFWKKIIPTFGPRLITWELVDNDIHYLKTLYEAGVNILASTDSGIPGLYPGYSLIEELLLLQEKVGVTPADALKMATLDAARFLHADSKYGSVEIGKIANLVLLDENPLSSVKALYQVSDVIKHGKHYQRAALIN
ncbi:amidohydrolase family protein [Thalassotalea ganghwensis]